MLEVARQPGGRADGRFIYAVKEDMKKMLRLRGWVDVDGLS